MPHDDTERIPTQSTQELPRTTAIRHTRRIIFAMIGFTAIVAGVIGFAVPVLPGFVLILAGLAILAREFVWARKLQWRLRDRLKKLKKGRANR